MKLGPVGGVQEADVTYYLHWKLLGLNSKRNLGNVARGIIKIAETIIRVDHGPIPVQSEHSFLESLPTGPVSPYYLQTLYILCLLSCDERFLKNFFYHLWTVDRGPWTVNGRIPDILLTNPGFALFLSHILIKIHFFDNRLLRLQKIQ